VKYIAISFLLLFGCTCLAQTDSLLFRSLTQILTRENGLGFKDQVFISVNKYDLEHMSIKDTTELVANGRAYKIILLKEPNSKKDLYVLPIQFAGNYYIAINITTCHRGDTDKTFSVAYSKGENILDIDGITDKGDNLFRFVSYDIMEQPKFETIRTPDKDP
jgi:hypothetical protein